MIKVLFLIDSLGAGGKERQLVEIVKFLDKSNFSVGVISFSSNDHYEKEIQHSVDYYSSLKKRPTRLEPLFNIWKHIRAFKPDIIHTWDSLSTFYSILPAKVYRISLVDGSIRDAGIDHGWSFYFRVFTMKMANLIVANSQAGLAAYNVRGKVLYNAIDISRFSKRSINEFNIIMVASFSDYKDHSTFLKASIRLLKKNIVDNVFLLGDGKNRRFYEDKVNKSYSEYTKRIIFTGTVENVENYLGKCKVGVLCSTITFKEGVSNSILEYMSAGLIALATNVGGTKEIISNKKNGFLLKEKNADDIVRIVTDIKNEKFDLSEIIINAKETIQMKFNHLSNLQKLEKIYKSLKS